MNQSKPWVANPVPLPPVTDPDQDDAAHQEKYEKCMGEQNQIGQKQVAVYDGESP